VCECHHYHCICITLKTVNPFWSYVGPRLTLWFSCFRHFSWSLTLSNPIFLPPAYSPALIYFGQERGWWITCNYPIVLKEKNRNRKSTTCAIYWLKSILHEEKRQEQENHNVGPRPTFWFSCFRRFSWSLTLSNPIFLPPAYSAALIYFGRERGWWFTCKYPTVLKEKKRNRKSTTCAICWLKSTLHEEKRWEQENHNVGQGPT
jgi:hypothetical protein